MFSSRACEHLIPFPDQLHLHVSVEWRLNGWGSPSGGVPFGVRALPRGRIPRRLLRRPPSRASRPQSRAKLPGGSRAPLDFRLARLRARTDNIPGGRTDRHERWLGGCSAARGRCSGSGAVPGGLRGVRRLQCGGRGAAGGQLRACAGCQGVPAGGLAHTCRRPCSRKRYGRAPKQSPIVTASEFIWLCFHRRSSHL